jgi:cytidylate kinase
LLVAIDGPAGAGKSAAARELARRLGVPYLDTGAMYRAVALLAQRAGVRFPCDAETESQLGEMARSMEIGFRGPAAQQRVFLRDEDVTLALRTPEISRLASQVSAITVVRRALVARQRELAAATGGVVEGRDIGSVVFPDAPVKVFLTASPEVRAERRLTELRRRGAHATWEDVLAEQRERDLRDTTRVDSPLTPAAGAVIVDSSALSLDQVVEKLAAEVAAAVDSASA